MSFPSPFSFHSDPNSLSTIESMDARTTTPRDSWGLDSIEPMDTRTTTPVASEMLLRHSTPMFTEVPRMTPFQQPSFEFTSARSSSEEPDSLLSFHLDNQLVDEQKLNLKPDSSYPSFTTPDKYLSTFPENQRDEIRKTSLRPEGTPSLTPDSLLRIFPEKKLDEFRKNSLRPGITPSLTPDSLLRIFPEKKLDEIRKNSMRPGSRNPSIAPDNYLNVFAENQLEEIRKNSLRPGSSTSFTPDSLLRIFPEKKLDEFRKNSMRPGSRNPSIAPDSYLNVFAENQLEEIRKNSMRPGSRNPSIAPDNYLNVFAENQLQEIRKNSLRPGSSTSFTPDSLLRIFPEKKLDQFRKNSMRPISRSPSVIPDNYISIFPEDQLEDVRKASEGSLIFENGPEPQVTFSEAQLVYEKLAKERLRQSKQGLFAPDTPSSRLLSYRALSADRGRYRRGSYDRQGNSTRNRKRSYSLPDLLRPNNASRMRSHSFPMDDKELDASRHVSFSNQRILKDLPADFDEERLEHFTAKLSRLPDDSWDDNRGFSGTGIDRDSDEDARDTLLRILLGDARNSVYSEQSEPSSGATSTPTRFSMGQDEGEVISLDNLMGLLLNQVSKQNRDSTSLRDSSTTSSRLSRELNPNRRDPTSLKREYPISIADSLMQQEFLRHKNADKDNPNYWKKPNTFFKRDDGLRSPEPDPSLSHISSSSSARSRGTKKTSSIAAALSTILASDAGIRFGRPSMARESDGALCIGRSKTHLGVDAAIQEYSVSLALQRGMNAEETMEVLMRRLQNKMTEEDFDEDDISEQTVMDLFTMTPGETEIVMENLTSSLKEGGPMMFAGDDTGSLVQVFLNQLYEDTSRYGASVDSSRRSSSSDDQPLVIEKTKILVLKQPDPDRQTELHAIAVVFLEEAYSITDDVKVYFPPLQECRYGGAMCYHNGYVYVLGGVYEGGASTRAAKINIFEAKPQWVTLNRMPHHRRLHSAVVYGDFIYVYGGLNKTNATGWTGDIYNIDENKWGTRSGMRRARKEFAVVQCKNHIYAIGGTSARNKPVKIVERYEKRSNEWKSIGVLNQGRNRCAAVSIDDLLYVIGGQTAEFSICVSRNGKGHWKEIFRGPRPRWNCSACVLGRKIYILGGFYNSREEPANEINRFDPYTRLWETVGEARGVYMNSCVTVESQSQFVPS